MPRWVDVINIDRGREQILRARWCSTFTCKLRGLMFRKGLGENEGLLLVEKSESRLNTSIHMLGVFFPIGVIWLGKGGNIVDFVLAKPWRFYAPKTPAMYILEGAPEILKDISIGHQIEFVHVETT